MLSTHKHHSKLSVAVDVPLPHWWAHGMGLVAPMTTPKSMQSTPRSCHNRLRARTSFDWGGLLGAQAEEAAKYVTFLAQLPPLCTVPRAMWPLLPPKATKHMGMMTLVLDMDETMIHTSHLGYQGSARVCTLKPWFHPIVYVLSPDCSRRNADGALGVRVRM